MEAIHIMRAGKHTSSDGTAINFTDAMLKGVAGVYNRALHEAPIVVGHPKSDNPAYGWVDKLEVRPDGLYAIPRQVNAEFADLVKAGAYKKVSGSFYRPDSPNAPVSGSWYLRHVGFLGAAAPAVKGLKPVEFADEAAFLDFEESTLDLREHRIAIRERSWAQTEDRRFIDEIMGKGTLPIGLKDEALVFMETLSDKTSLDFTDEDGETVHLGNQAHWFRKLLSSLPVPVVQGEIARGDFVDDVAEFSAPQGYKVDPEASQIHMAAVAYQRRHNVSYADAVKAIVPHGKASQ
jgi:hypothetical protein